MPKFCYVGDGFQFQLSLKLNAFIIKLQVLLSDNIGQFHLYFTHPLQKIKEISNTRECEFHVDNLLYFKIKYLLPRDKPNPKLHRTCVIFLKFTLPLAVVHFSRIFHRGCMDFKQSRPLIHMKQPMFTLRHLKTKNPSEMNDSNKIHFMKLLKLEIS